jgi:hypothetical protein
MSGPLDVVIARLKAAIEKLDTATITATRAQADAQQAHTHYADAGRGSTHPAIEGAKMESTTAAEKAGKVGRLLAETSTHLTAYVNTIAPGSISTGQSGAAMPSGEQLVSEAERRGRRADIAWRKQVKKAEDIEGNLQKAEDGAKEVIGFIKQKMSPPGGTSTGTVAEPPALPPDRPQIDHPVTAAVMAAGALAVVARSVWNHGKTRRARKHDDDQA